MKNFYKRFKAIARLPFWRPYLRKVYKTTNQDAKRLGTIPVSDRKKFTSLLCGVSGEITAEEYLNFTLSINKNAKIIIIDLGDEQIKSVKNIVREKFSKFDIAVKKANALDLDFIKDHSIDWIDTDGFFSFFDEKMLSELFSEWKRILKKEGYITFRELVSNGSLSWLVNYSRMIISLFYINTKIYMHNKKELLTIFSKLNFKYRKSISPIPLLDRYCLGAI